MQKIIDGKRYDTETATYIKRRYSPDELESEEDLYLTKKGQFFIHIIGNRFFEEDIKTVKKGEALKWLNKAGADEATLEAAGLGTVDG